MPFDALTTRAIVTELKSLIGYIVRRVFQPERDEIRLLLGGSGKEQSLLISANPNSARIHLSGTKKPNPMTPPTFCMTLRKYLVGAKIVNVYQLESDRVIILTFERPNELFELTTYGLICELTAKNANLILCRQTENGWVILDALKHIGSLKSRYRHILPGISYVAPPMNNKQNLFTVSDDELKNDLSQNQLSIYKALSQSLLGLSRRFIDELCFEVGIEPETMVKDLTEYQKDELIERFQEFLNRPNEPFIFKQGDRLLDFYPIPLTYLGSESESYPSFSQMLEAFYRLRDKQNYFRAKSSNLKHQLTQLRKKTAKKIQNLNHDLIKNQNFEKFKTKADLINQNLWQLKPKLSEAVIIDYSQNPPEEIKLSLNPQLTPAENAQKLYKKYNKAKRALVEIDEQLSLAQADLDYIDSLLTALDISTELNELSEIKDEFNRSGLVSTKPSKTVKQEPSKPYHFVSSEGFEIIVGKNNYQNDHLVTHIGKDEDCWLHVKDAPGSHVIIKADGKFIPEQTVLEAGNLAAFFSSQSGGENVPVNYTEFKNVKKLKGAKPGMVTFSTYETMFVTPEKAQVESLQTF